MKNILILFCLLTAQSNAQTFTEKLKDFSKKEGFFNYYIDEKNAQIYLEITDFNKEFLYVNSLSAGLGSNDLGLDRAQLGEERVVYFEKIGKKIFLTQPNLKFRAISSDKNEQNAVKQSFASSVLWGFTSEFEENGHVFVNITDFLLRDSHDVANKIKQDRQGSYQLNASRSALYFDRTKNFPKNSEFEAMLTFTGGQDAGNYVRSVAPSTEAITLQTHHSFIQLPDNEYEMRIFDPRSSYYPISFYDFATPVTEPIQKYYIARHRLKKKDPAAAISEAVKPIVYYLDNGTPEPIRSALLDGARWWNQAFEAVGYKDAFQVKILPDDADPMDCRYNMINWVHRSTRGWSYGSSVTDPRTGEIIKGHVSLGSLRVRQDYLIATGLLAPFESGEPIDSNNKMLQMAVQRLRQLAAHEVGHTLGLMHNYASSINNLASVMDYPHPKLELDEQNNISLGNAYTNEIGEWDKISIAFGYQDFAKGTDEKKALNNILQNAIDKGLLYLTDQDARPAGSVSGTAHLWDNGQSPQGELRHIMKIREVALAKFSEKNLRNGQPLAFLEDVLVPVYNLPRYQLEAACKIIGGKNYSYATRGDGQKAMVEIPFTEQKNTLEAVLESISPKYLAISNTILNMIPPRPAGYNYSGELFNKRTGLSFDPLAAAEALVAVPISLLLNVERANRLAIDGAKDGSFGLQNLLNTIYDKTFKANRLTGLQGLIQNQSEAIIVAYLASLKINEQASHATKSICKQYLQNWKSEFSKMKLTSKDLNFKAHLTLLLEQIDNPNEIKAIQTKAMAPGAPIGCGDEY